MSTGLVQMNIRWLYWIRGTVHCETTEDWLEEVENCLGLAFPPDWSILLGTWLSRSWWIQKLLFSLQDTSSTGCSFYCKSVNHSSYLLCLSDESFYYIILYYMEFSIPVPVCVCCARLALNFI